MTWPQLQHEPSRVVSNAVDTFTESIQKRMPLNTNLLRRIRSWVLAGAPCGGLESADLDAGFVVEDGVFRITPPDSAAHAQMGAAMTDVNLVAELNAESGCCIVVRARDDVTNMWHQIAWLFEFADDKVLRLVRTSSAQIPPRPYDGTLPLREAD